MRTTADGKRLFVSLNMAGNVVMFDTSNPEAPKVLKVLDPKFLLDFNSAFPAGAARPHGVAFK